MKNKMLSADYTDYADNNNYTDNNDFPDINNKKFLAHRAICDGFYKMVEKEVERCRK